MYARVRYNNTRLLFKHYVTVLTGNNNNNILYWVSLYFENTVE